MNDLTKASAVALCGYGIHLASTEHWVCGLIAGILGFVIYEHEAMKENK